MATSSSATTDEDSITLRSVLDDRQSQAFASGGLADIQLNHASIHLKIAEMNRGLIAYEALCKLLLTVGSARAISKLLEAIDEARRLGLISKQEEKYLRYFNKQANKAKHTIARLPF